MSPRARRGYRAMIKVLVWLAGAAGFLFAIFHFGYWKEAAALAVLAAAFVWIFGGAYLLGRGQGAPRAGWRQRAAEAAAMREVAAREQKARGESVPR